MGPHGGSSSLSEEEEPCELVPLVNFCLSDALCPDAGRCWGPGYGPDTSRTVSEADLSSLKTDCQMFAMAAVYKLNHTVLTVMVK